MPTGLIAEKLRPAWSPWQSLSLRRAVVSLRSGLFEHSVMDRSILLIHEAIADFSGGNSAVDLIWRHIPHDHGPGRNDRAPADRNPAFDDRPVANPHIISDDGLAHLRASAENHGHAGSIPNMIVAHDRDPRGEHRIGTDAHVGTDDAVHVDETVGPCLEVPGYARSCWHIEGRMHVCEPAAIPTHGHDCGTQPQIECRPDQTMQHITAHWMPACHYGFHLLPWSHSRPGGRQVLARLPRLGTQDSRLGQSP